MKNIITWIACLICQFPLAAQEQRADTVPTVVAATKESQILLSHKQFADKQYLAFPALIQLPNDEVLITLKRGTAHGNDREAVCDIIRLSTATNRVTAHQTIGSIADRKFQITVPLQTPDGKLHFYTDLQHTGPDGRHYREGMLYTTSEDDGKTYKPWTTLNLVDGVEYAYPFDFVIDNNVIYMLAMSFGYRPGGRWSVAVLKSEDAAQSWTFVKNITEALGDIAINESAFLRTADGFAVVVRGYHDQPTQIAKFDKSFNLVSAKDLTGTGILEGLIGWPRIFSRDGKLYVLGRIRLPGTAFMQLGLLRVNAENLAIEQVALLDNETGTLPVKDGYYAGFYWTEKDGATWLNTVTYRSVANDEYPDIVRLAFRWEEVQ
ncbi:hypothetical protein SAMN05660226_04078 [Parapedobacter luteus]|uniref:BNR repeat-like domain-containing protein n=1 Tax=Parapedobacter luteus TaxID=623280 RepID=A0A1T5FLS9_9SPHI|nr:sialidase family protein [Parapedobacter luteus]SKB97133.1 hypothetical protein SAMN05660226_04078 [Parapedobacter luteus]